ncbi:MAG: hypothetical protein MZV63_05850 [Marinilabiliales bacterium]|nr:hypothetical protein [Marinilabiliales bacterium]
MTAGFAGGIEYFFPAPATILSISGKSFQLSPSIVLSHLADSRTHAPRIPDRDQVGMISHPHICRGRCLSPAIGMKRCFNENTVTVDNHFPLCPFAGFYYHTVGNDSPVNLAVNVITQAKPVKLMLVAIAAGICTCHHRLGPVILFSARSPGFRPYDTGEEML